MREVIEEIADEVGGTFEPEYSGRGMYGDTCVGIDCDDDLEVIEAAARHGIRRPTVDNMGKGFICYWPGVK